MSSIKTQQDGLYGLSCHDHHPSSASASRTVRLRLTTAKTVAVVFVLALALTLALFLFACFTANTALASVAMPSLRSWALAALAFAQCALGAPSPVRVRAGNVDAWLADEAEIALDRILSNIGSTGQYAASAKSGVVIASPSTDNPDCTVLFIPVNTCTQPRYEKRKRRKEKEGRKKKRKKKKG